MMTPGNFPIANNNLPAPIATADSSDGGGAIGAADKFPPMIWVFL